MIDFLMDCKKGVNGNKVIYTYSMAWPPLLDEF